MKIRNIFFLLVCISFSTSVLFAQSQTNEQKTFADSSRGITDSSFSYASYPVYKVYETSDVYVVMYQKAGVSLSKCVIPKTWSKNSTSVPKKLEMRKLTTGLQPYMVYITKDGTFYKAILSLPTSRMDSTWGILKNDNKINESEISKDTLSLN